MTSTIRGAVYEAIQELLVEIPPAGSGPQQRANFLLHKAEVFELIAVVGGPCLAGIAREVANDARYEASRITDESTEQALS